MATVLMILRWGKSKPKANHCTPDCWVSRNSKSFMALLILLLQVHILGYFMSNNFSGSCLRAVVNFFFFLNSFN